MKIRGMQQQPLSVILKILCKLFYLVYSFYAQCINNFRTQHTVDFDINESEETTDDLQKERKFIVFESCLLSLFSQCCKCGLEVELKTSIRGTLLVVNGSCPNGHDVHWQSQPTVRNMVAGNLLLPAAILFSELTYTTSFANMAGILNVPMISESYFYRIQKSYLYPVIHSAYLLPQQAVLEFLRDEGLHLSGDGRCDSPGYSANIALTLLWTVSVTSF